MDAAQIQLIRDSFGRVAPIAETAAALFYRRLFETDPSAAPLFARTDLAEQGRKLMAALGFIVASLDRLEELVPAAEALARRHLAYGVVPAQYGSVGAALLWTLGQGLGDGFTPEVEAAWTEAYATLSGVMVAAAHPPGPG